MRCRAVPSGSKFLRQSASNRPSSRKARSSQSITSLGLSAGTPALASRSNEKFPSSWPGAELVDDQGTLRGDGLLHNARFRLADDDMVLAQQSRQCAKVADDLHAVRRGGRLGPRHIIELGLTADAHGDVPFRMLEQAVDELRRFFARAVDQIENARARPQAAYQVGQRDFLVALKTFDPEMHGETNT